ncbi:energy-coupling factor ABC transporter ATP-binding protein [Peribacillus asahii]|uniref:ABC transporter ATP-binding protein n=1 Tax=Peribacillus asahii TaxID=228899 RepID=A0A3Q9RSZ1_9BACI|nr:ATP-binding cassette domain-containing protein [Peribacillus asahii]AZV45521.1 cobalt import ATP-binding protein cbiO 7 [Peribacillus asahii]USK85086.1 ATP-binding cassette domain-containing protein [Peribacillus asahii]
MDELFFKIDQLTHRYVDGTTALKNLSLSVKKGKKIALLGNNGAGKSTLFQHLNGILQPTTGSILFKGEQVQYNRKFLMTLRKQVGIVFQDPDSQLFSGNVRQDISFGPMNLGWSQEKVHKQVEWAMEQTEVTALQDRPIHFLSLGQKKRVAIAGVLAMNPEVFILDEPSAGLDAYYSKQIMHILRDIHQEDKTIILSTHDVHFAYEWADEIIVMSDGEILYHGDPVTVFHNEALLNQAHLEKPWVFETAQQLLTKQLLRDEGPMPRSKEELFQLLK